MKSIIIVIVLLTFFLAGCGKNEQGNIKTENQSSTQNVVIEQKVKEQKEVNKRWIGQYSFDESAPGVTGESSQSWGYVINISQLNDTLLLAELQVDGYQTMTRLEAEVKATPKSAELYFMKYGKENIFEQYRKGEKLLSLELSDKNEILTNWEKMKPNLPANQKSGRVMFKKISA
jgi:Family of unknown function (DUF5991)